jgi:hypothetical protein
VHLLFLDMGDASRWHGQLMPRFATHPATGEVSGVGASSTSRPKFSSTAGASFISSRQRAAETTARARSGGVD